ncbi:MAG: ribosome maturation factor RimM [Ornithinimicrobium sp.]|uniref:ribosome maturation factor RimM n=1 Tax=Ornithinimicrobium sp. TaxID=1977084 RepID=UPI003D9ABDE9
MVSTHVVARIGKPHGLRGEVTVQTHTDRPEHRFVEGAQFATDPSDPGPLTIATVRQHQGVFLLGFEGVRDRSAAEALRDTRLLSGDVRSQDQGGGARSDADVDDEGWYEEELLGLPVTLLDGTVLGEVSALHTRDVQDLLGVRLPDGRDALVPFVEQIVTEIVLPDDGGDQGAARVVVDPPAGLLDLDATGE